MKRPIRRLAMALVVAAVGATVVVAAGGAGRTKSQVGAGGTYKMGWEQSFGFTDNLDPVGEYLGEAFGIHTNLLTRTLVGYRSSPTSRRRSRSRRTVARPTRSTSSRA